MMTFNELPLELLNEIKAISKKTEVKANEIIISKGDKVEFIPFVIDGSLRVYVENEDINKELLLYKVEDGQTCMLSIIAAFSDKISKVCAEAQTNSKLMLIPITEIRKWQVKYEEWNDLILDSFISRYNDLIATIEELSFKKIEDRLVIYLKNYTDKSGYVVLNKTNKEVANDIASSREVVSRTLKKLEIDQKIKFKSN